STTSSGSTTSPTASGRGRRSWPIPTGTGCARRASATAPSWPGSGTSSGSPRPTRPCSEARPLADMTPPAGVDRARRRGPAPAALAWLRRTGGRVGPDGRALGRIVGYFVVTRLALFIVAACAIRLLPAPNHVRIEAYLGRNPSLTTWVRWDAWWYVSVIERGYWFDSEGQSNVAFLPVFPLLMRLVMTVVDNAVV